MSNLYSPRADERRRQFNRIIDGCNMVLMNNIDTLDESIWDNWIDKSPASVCEIDGNECIYHGVELEDGECPYQDEMPEVYQWFAVNTNDAEFLARHNQFVTYSDMLDTHFLAITHFGTSWDYVDSMVADFEDMYTGLDNFDNEEAK